MTKNGLIIIFTYYHNPYSLIFGVFGVFGVFGRFLVIFSAINGHPTLSIPALGGHKSDKKWIDYRFHLFSRPLEFHFGRFLAFLANFWGFSVQQRGISTYLPRVWGGHKSDKKWIYYGFHPFSRPLESHFWRFLAFLANFWRFSAQKVIFRLIDPGFGGVTKVIKIDIFIREKLGILGKLCPRNLCSDDDNYLFQTLA